MHEVPRTRTKVVRACRNYSQLWPEARISNTAITPKAQAIWEKRWNLGSMAQLCLLTLCCRNVGRSMIQFM